MTRVLGVVAGLLWVAGIVVLIVGFIGLPRIEGAYYTEDVGAQYDVGYTRSGAGDDHAQAELVTGIVLVGVAGVLTGGLVLRRGRRSAG